MPCSRHLTSAVRWGCLLCLVFALTGMAADYYVSVEGADDAARDGRSPERAWGSLAFACERVPAGPHVIHLGPGTFTARRTARPKDGVTLAGSGMRGTDATRIVASSDWPLSPKPDEADGPDAYVVALEKRRGVTIQDIEFTSRPDHRINGAIFCRGCEEVTIARVSVQEFRWSGLHLETSRGLQVHHCWIENASTDKGRFFNGLIRTRWIKHSELHHNWIVSSAGGGYGYKGGGHEHVRIHHNHFQVAGGFAIESAHENEYGVEIDHNYANRCFSIPKSGQGADPNTRGYPYSFWIHDNLLTDSYTTEGPRNHLRFDHNYVRIEKPNGRVYTHHGGINHGPVWIHHNVVVNLDRAFVWMNRGLAENIHVYNNTVYCADAGQRAGTLIDSYSSERLNGWMVRNNVFVAPATQPRKLYPTQRGVPTKITADHNLCVRVAGAPPGNFTGQDPGLRLEGERPWPFYAPRPGAFVVDRGVDVGLPFKGNAPDLGAYELGEERRLESVPLTPP